MGTTGTTIQELATEAASYFETARRATGDTETGPREDGESYVRTKDGAPQWIQDLVQSAHGMGGEMSMLPDDWRYASISSALDHLAEYGEDEDAAFEWADANVDVYSGARIDWLGSHLWRPGYVDEAVEEMGSGPGIIENIGLGQYAESREVYGLVLRALADRLEEIEEEEGEEVAMA